ncbi:MAG: hypothetical protein J5726_07985 [Treponema sp.]|nr:hypothetical protein [Treponema sp.]
MKTYKVYNLKSFSCLFLLIFFLFFKPTQLQAQSEPFYNNFFLKGGIQKHFAIAELSDYISTKPEWCAGMGYTFLNGSFCSIPVSFEAAHCVISGTNSMVHSFDLWPFLFSAGVELFPTSVFSFGIDAGAGPYLATIRHFESAIDLIQNKLTTTKGSGCMFSVKLYTGFNLFDRALELRLSGSFDCIIEKDGLIPLPAFNVSIVLYPFKTGRE